jgi:undecaprenyl-diphosphatase
MSLLEAFLLGLAQGITEFLPVSSSGHLVIGQTLLDIQVPGVVFEVTVHLATLLSVLVVFRKRVAELAAGAVRLEGEAWRYLGLIALASVPAAVVGLGVRGAMEALFEAPYVTGLALLATGTFLWTSRRAMARDPAGKPGIRDALLMGIAQAFAIVPGISRSGATVVAGLWLGVGAEEAAAFSFLMAVPAILGAAALQFPELPANGGFPDVTGGIGAGGSGAGGFGADGLGAGPLALGGIVAAVVGVVAIWAFVTMLKKKSFHRFAGYCWGVGGLFLFYLLLKG